MKIKGIEVQQVLVASAVDIASEYYVSLTVDRAAKSIQCIASASGGMEIEEIAVKEPQKIVAVRPGSRERARPRAATSTPLARAFAAGPAPSRPGSIVAGMYRLFAGKDCSLVEINPCALDPRRRAWWRRTRR